MKYLLNEYIDNSRLFFEQCVSIVASNEYAKPIVVRQIHKHLYYLALNSLLNEQDIYKARTYFSFAVVGLHKMNHYDYYFTLPTQEISSLFLSGTKEQLDYYYQFNFVAGSRCAYSKAIVMGPMVVAAFLLKNEKEKAENAFNKWIRGSGYKKGVVFYHHLDLFFSGLLKGNQGDIRAGIDKIVEPKNLKFYINEYGPWETEFCTIANFCAKLSWILGYEIEFKNVQVNMDLVKLGPSTFSPTIDDLILEFS